MEFYSVNWWTYTINERSFGDYGNPLLDPGEQSERTRFFCFDIQIIWNLGSGVDALLLMGGQPYGKSWISYSFSGHSPLVLYSQVAKNWTPSRATNQPSNKHIVIGRLFTVRENINDHWSGKLDELIVWDELLTDQQIQQLYTTTTL